MAGPVWRVPGTHALRWMIQHHLKRTGRYGGPADGAWGPETIKGVQRTLKLAFNDITVDGVGGPQTASQVELYGLGENKNHPAGYPLQDGAWQGFHDRIGKAPSFHS